VLYPTTLAVYRLNKSEICKLVSFYQVIFSGIVYSIRFFTKILLGLVCFRLLMNKTYFLILMVLTISNFFPFPITIKIGNLFTLDIIFITFIWYVYPIVLQKPIMINAGFRPRPEVWCWFVISHSFLWSLFLLFGVGNARKNLF
jgi:hypothetical protein